MGKKLRILLIVLLALLLVLLAGLFVRIRTVTVSGNTAYTDEEVEQLVFSSDLDRSLTGFLFNRLTGKTYTLPFVSSCTVRLTGLTSAEIRLQEDRIVAYIDYLDDHIYFNRDGLVLEISKELYPGIPRVSGLTPEYMVLGEPLPLGSGAALDQLTRIVQFLDSHSLTTDGEETLLSALTSRIDFDEYGSITCYIGEIAVRFGKGTGLEEKLTRMLSILPQIEGRSGTLHLESLDGGGGTFLFE